MTFVPEARPFTLPPLVAAGVLLLIGLPGWATAFALLALGLLLFFRNPRRSWEGDPGVVLAAADGKVLRVDEVEDADLDGRRLRRIVTFLSVFDVHVQRSPVAGEVVLAQFREGAKLAAFRDGAGKVNQQQLTVFQTDRGELVGVRQIAGLVARRVVSYLETGATVERGDPMGVIKFGSRVDLLLPSECKIEVSAGDRVRAGETPMARLP